MIFILLAICLVAVAIALAPFVGLWAYSIKSRQHREAEQNSFVREQIENRIKAEMRVAELSIQLYELDRQIRGAQLAQVAPEEWPDLIIGDE